MGNGSSLAASKLAEADAALVMYTWCLMGECLARALQSKEVLKLPLDEALCPATSVHQSCPP